MALSWFLLARPYFPIFLPFFSLSLSPLTHSFTHSWRFGSCTLYFLSFLCYALSAKIDVITTMKCFLPYTLSLLLLLSVFCKVRFCHLFHAHKVLTEMISFSVQKVVRCALSLSLSHSLQPVISVSFVAFPLSNRSHAGSKRKWSFHSSNQLN